MDIRLDDSFDIFLDQTNDLATVSGQEKFEQRLRIAVTKFFTERIGSVNKPAALDMLRLQARRVASEMDELESLAQIRAEVSVENPNVVELTVVYDTGDDFSFAVFE